MTELLEKINNAFTKEELKKVKWEIYKAFGEKTITGYQCDMLTLIADRLINGLSN